MNIYFIQYVDQTYREVLKSSLQLNVRVAVIPRSRQIASYFHIQ